MIRTLITGSFIDTVAGKPVRRTYSYTAVTDSGIDSRAVESNTVASGVRPTSRDAYSRIKTSGRLSAQQSQVLAAFDGGDYTRQELAKKTGLGINVICGRIAEIIESGDVREVGRRECGVTHEIVTTLRRVAMEAAA